MCVPTRIEGLAIGELGQSIVYGARVPAGMVWEIDAAGIGTSSNIGWPVDYALNIAHATFADGSDWFIPLPVARFNHHFHGTPMVSLTNTPLRLYAGQALMARSNGLTNGAKMDLFYVGISYPVECLGRRLFSPASSALPPPVDLSALNQAAQAAATALSDLAESVP